MKVKSSKLYWFLVFAAKTAYSEKYTWWCTCSLYRSKGLIVRVRKTQQVLFSGDYTLMKTYLILHIYIYNIPFQSSEMLHTGPLTGSSLCSSVWWLDLVYVVSMYVCNLFTVFFGHNADFYGGGHLFGHISYWKEVVFSHWHSNLVNNMLKLKHIQKGLQQHAN